MNKHTLIRGTVGVLLSLLFVPLAFADIPREEFERLSKQDMEDMRAECVQFAYNEDKVSIMKARTEAMGRIITKAQVRVMLYTACMLKTYENDLLRMSRSLPTEES